MPSDEQEMARAVRLVAVAVVSAVVTATAVIGVGQFWIARSSEATSAGRPLLIHTAG